MINNNVVMTILLMAFMISRFIYVMSMHNTQSGHGVTPQRNGVVHQLAPQPTSLDSYLGLTIVDLPPMKLCDTDPQKHVLSSLAFLADECDHNAPIYVVIDQCTNVYGLSLFGVSRQGNANVMFRGHWPHLRVTGNHSLSSFLWRVNSTSIVAALDYHNKPSIVILSLPIIMTTKDHEMESPKCIIPLSQSMDDIVMISHNSSIGIATNNKTLTIIAFDINDCSLKWNVSLSYLSFDPFNSTISLVHWMSRVAINNDATIAFSVVAANNSLILIAFDLMNKGHGCHDIPNFDRCSTVGFCNFNGE
jgi:hypothetical protein